LKDDNGDEYTGSFEDYECHGYGVAKYSDGDRFEGLFERDCLTDGTMFYANGDKYQGQWKGNWLRKTKHGKGVFTWANGDRYEGEFKNNK
jgi:hypothetical protein